MTMTAMNTIELKGRAMARKARSIKGRAEREATEHVDSFFYEVEELLKKVGESSDAEIVLIRSKVENAMRDARKALDDGAKKARKSARRGSKAANKYARNNPWVVAGVAIGIGALIGLSLKR